MKKEVIVCDACGEVVKEGYTLFGSLYHIESSENSSLVAGGLLGAETHFCKLCFAKRCKINWVQQR